jgi:hypothetical protein
MPRLLTPEEAKLAFSTNAFSGPMNPTFMKMESHLPGSKIPIARASRAGVAGTGQGSEPTRGGFLMASRQEAPVIPMMKRAAHEEPEDVVVEVRVSKQGAEQLQEILRNLQRMGSMGCSREILLDQPIDGKKNTIGWWDGDGSSKIRSATVAGEDFFKKAEMESFAEGLAKRDKDVYDRRPDLRGKRIGRLEGDAIIYRKIPQTFKEKEKDSETMDTGMWPYKPGDFKPAKLSSVQPSPALMDALLRAFDRHMGKTAASPAEMLEETQHAATTPNVYSNRGSSIREVALPKMLTTIGTIARAPVAAVDKGGKI